MTHNTSTPDHPESGTIFTRNFWLLCFSSVLFMMSFSFPLFELAEFLKRMDGGEAFVGFIIGLFTVSAGLSRLWSGRLADRIGRRPVMIFGTIVTAVCGGLYIFTTTILSFLALRFVHGLSTGWRPTATTAMLADVVPPKRIGEAMGYLGMAGATGTALGPWMGSVVKEHLGFDNMFITASVLGVLAWLMTSRLQESLPSAQKFTWSMLAFQKDEPILDRSATPAFMTTLFETFSFGTIITLAPLLVDELNFEYKGSFNPSFIATSIAIRFIAGRASDRLGRLVPLMIGMVFMITAMLVLGFSTTRWMAIFGGILYGVAIGLNRPTIFAWTTDLARPGHVALSLATMLLALEIGIGAGAFITGGLYDEANAAETISSGFFLAACSGVLGLGYLIWYGLKSRGSAAPGA